MFRSTCCRGGQSRRKAWKKISHLVISAWQQREGRKLQDIVEGTVGEIFLSETNPFCKIAAYIIIYTLLGLLGLYHACLATRSRRSIDYLKGSLDIFGVHIISGASWTNKNSVPRWSDFSKRKVFHDPRFGRKIRRRNIARALSAALTRPLDVSEVS